jgi:pimeloyl-ACP methyl ester carboxylesterase
MPTAPTSYSGYLGTWHWSVFAFVIVAFASQRSWSQQAGKRIELETNDGVRLVCRYYASPHGESAVPVILLHEWKGQGNDLLSLGTFLNGKTAGRHAVIVPDLRGHGDSTARIGPDGAELPGKLDSSKMRKSEFDKIVRQDLEAVKRFLISEHNQRKLNIDMLCVGGADMGALAALHWTANDWNWPTLSGGRRQGQDVKALILVSPPLGFKGISANAPLGHEAIRDKVAIQILYGKTGKPAAAARRIHSTLGRANRDGAGYDFRAFETSLQGTALFTEKQLNVAGFIASFIKKHVVDHKESMPWKPRGVSGASTADAD